MTPPSDFTRSLGRWDMGFVSQQRDNLLRPADHEGWIKSLVWSAIMLMLIVPLLLWAGAPYLVVGLLILVMDLSLAIAEHLPGYRHRTTVRLRIAAVTLLPIALLFAVFACSET